MTLQEPHFECVIAVADVPSRNFVAFSADALRRLHDGRPFFWEEDKRRLVYRGPLSELNAKLQPGDSIE